MFHKILVPLDGSTTSESVLPQLSRPAMEDAEIVLLHVVPRVPQPVGAPLDQGLVLAEKAREYLGIASATLKRPRVTGIVRTGDAAEEIARVVEESRPDLVAMTTHGRSGLSRLLMGSVSESVVRSIRTPVFLVRPDTPPPARLLKRVLLPLDGSARSFRILEVIKPWAAARGAEISILHVQQLIVAAAGFAGGGAAIAHVVEPGEPDPKITELPLVLQREGFRSSIAVLQGDPVGAIVDQARSQDVDLIAMTTRGRTGIARVILGSVSEGVLRHADRPVLLHHAPEPEGS